MTAEAIIKTEADRVRLLKRLAEPTPLLKQIGALLVSDSKKAFDVQALGDIPWPERYPGQRPPFLNVAGAVADFAAGRTKPLERRFQPRPAGIDTRTTRNSIAAVVLPPDAVQVGSTSPQASRLQSGGESEQPITPTVKANMAKFLKPGKTRASPIDKEISDEELAAKAAANGLRYAPKKGKRGSDPRTDVEFTIPSPYRDKLGPLFNLTKLKTKTHARPFLGVTDQSRKDIVRAVEEYIATGQSGL